MMQSKKFWIESYMKSEKLKYAIPRMLKKKNLTFIWTFL